MQRGSRLAVLSRQPGVFPCLHQPAPRSGQRHPLLVLDVGLLEPGPVQRGDVGSMAVVPAAKVSDSPANAAGASDPKALACFGWIPWGEHRFARRLTGI